MWDFGYVAVSVLFFAIAIAYVAGCERLGAKEGRDDRGVVPGRGNCRAVCLPGIRVAAT